MTTFKKNNAIELDLRINEVMDALEYELNTRLGWGVDIYHKVYKEKPSREKKPIPYAFLTEYQPVFINDKINGEIGFVLEDKRPIILSNNKVSAFVVFSLNLDKLDGGSVQREDELIMKQAKNALYDYNPTLLTTGIKGVYEGFDTEKIIYSDMQPFINFSFKIDLVYIDNC